MKFKILFIALLVTACSWGQYSITGTGSGNTYTQNFNAFTGVLSTVPSNWVWTNTDYSPGNFYNRTALYSNLNSTYALRESSLPGTDIAFGGKNDGATYTLTFSAINNTGADINGFEIGWNVEQYSASSNPTPVGFTYRLTTGIYGLVNATGTGTTAVTASTLATSANLPSITVTAKAISITSIVLANGQTADFRITIGNTTGNHAHIGVDDFTIYATASVVTPCSTPTSQASSITNANTTVQGTDLSWTPGATATGSLVVIRPTADANALPVSGTNYTPSTAWGTAAQIDANNRVFYRSTGSSVTGITGLLPATSYTVTVYAYNGSGTNICYNTTTPESITFVTLAAEPTAHPAAFSCSTSSTTQIDLTFSAANTIAGNGYVILYRIGAAPTGVPTDGVLYAPGTVLGNATVFGYTSTSGSQTTYSVTGLNAGTVYHFSLVPFSSFFSDPSTINYRTAATIRVTNCTTTAGAEINVKGIVGVNPTIPDGDTTPQGTDNTLFATVVVGNNQPKSFRIENTGSAALNITSITMVGGNTGDFVVSGITLPATIPALGFLDFTVTFSPSAAGVRNTTLTIVNSDSNENPYDFVIQGTGTMVALVDINVKGNGQSIPDNSIYPVGTNHTAFGVATVGVTTVTRTFTIENLGSTALNLTGTPFVTITGPHAAMFTVTVQPSSGSIAGGASITFDITFNPNSPGAKNATVIIANNDSGEDPYNFNISGNAKGTNNIYVYGNGNDVVKGSGTTTPSNLTDFSSVAVPSGVKQNTFIVSNLSGISTYFSNVTISGANAALFTVIAQPTNNALGSGNSTSFTINFTPTSIGIKNAIVTFNVFTDPARTVPEPTDPVYTFAISGEGIIYTPCTNNAVQTLALQDFEAAPATPTYGYTFTTDGTVSIAGGTYNNGSGVRNAFIGARSFQMAGIGTSSSGNLVESTIITMAPIDVSQYNNINLSLKVAAFRTGTTQGLDINEFIQVETSTDAGVNWSTEAVLRGYSNSRWDFAASGVFNAYYTGTNSGATIDTRNGTADLPNGIATFNVNNLPQSPSLIIRFTLAVDRSDEIWAIDNIKIEGQLPQASTWNGTTWLPSFPTSTTKAIFDTGTTYTTTAAFERGSVAACELLIKSGATVNIDSNYNFEIQSNVTNEGILNVANNGSLVQVNDTALNTGNINYERNVASLRGYDYIYWSSPVLGQALGSLYSSPTPGFKYEWNPVALNPSGSYGFWIAPVSATMERAKGYIVRASNSYGWTGSLTSIFRGPPNNGVISPTLSRIANSAVVNDRWNLIGNPYPSALDAKAFLMENAVTNPKIDGYIGLWKHLNAPVSVTSPYYSTYQYNYTNDYLIYNRTGAQTQNGFDGYVASGQAFFVNLLQGTTTTSTITFKNAFRNKTYDNSEFLRTSQSEEGRIWLDLVNSANVPVRSLIGYIDGATQERDRLYDAITTIGINNSIHSVVDNEIFVIQGRPVPFDTNDQVVIGYNAKAVGTYKIAIAGVDGLFTQDQPIYVEDKLLGIIHDLRQSPYTFDSAVGVFNDRFVLRYTTTTLGNPTFETLENSVIVSSKNNEMTINSSIETIQEVTVYDILGRQLLKSKNIATNSFVAANIAMSQQALIVKIKLANGLVVTRKIIQ